MLAVELDGEQHIAEHDAIRDQELLNLGILTYRIPNRQFFRLDEAPYTNELSEIRRLCELRSGRKAFEN